jgi:hypothetical protein
MRMFVWGLALALVGALSVPGAPVSSEAKTKPATPAEKIKAALDKVIDFDIDNQPLHLALNQLKEQTGVTFVLDRFTLQQMGMDPEQIPVHFKAKGVKVRSGLRSMVGQFNLGFAIVGENVVITTDEMAMFRQIRQRVNVDYENVEYAAAIKQLSRETAVNLIIDPRAAKEAKGMVTLQLEDVPLDMAVRLMSEMVGLKPVRVGNVMFICSKAAADDLRKDPDLFPPPPNPMVPGVLPGIGFPGAIGALGVGGFAPGGFGALGGPPPLVPPVAPPPGAPTAAPTLPVVGEQPKKVPEDAPKPEPKPADPKPPEPKPER